MGSCRKCKTQHREERERGGGHQIYICYKSVLCLSLWQQNGVEKPFDSISIHSWRYQRKEGDEVTKGHLMMYTTLQTHALQTNVLCDFRLTGKRRKLYTAACLVRLYVRACILDSYRQQLLLCINQWSMFELLAAQTPPKKSLNLSLCSHSWVYNYYMYFFLFFISSSIWIYLQLVCVCACTPMSLYIIGVVPLRKSTLNIFIKRNKNAHMLLNRLSSSSLLPKNKIIMLNNKQKELKIKWVEKNKNKKTRNRVEFNWAKFMTFMYPVNNRLNKDMKIRNEIYST